MGKLTERLMRAGRWLLTPLHLGGCLVALALAAFLLLHSPNSFHRAEGAPHDRKHERVSHDANAPGHPPGGAPRDPGEQFVASVLADTEDVWGRKIAELGGRYPPPKRLIFTDEVTAACGLSSAASGAFYCPSEQRVYIDLSFLKELEEQSGAPSEFARAYVVAHEVGHHMQLLLGATEAVQDVRRRSTAAVATRALLAMELQADCYAGVWAREANALHRAKGQPSYIESGDIAAALTAASAVGDRTLRRRAKQRIIPEAFTHGTPKQRVDWFQRGFDSGKIERCDAFNSPGL
jgi:hypothetical protein